MASATALRSALSKGIRCHSYPCLTEASSLSSWKSAYRFLYQASCRRSFTANVTKTYPRRTDVLSSPRWINRQSAKSNDKNGFEEENEEEGAEDTSKRHTKPEGSESETRMSEKEDERGSASSSDPPSSGGGQDGSSGEGSSSSSSAPPPHRESAPPTAAISRQNIPENYPQVLALPIARRPLFPGFYKAVVIRNPAVVAAIKEMMKRGQPYLGAFLLKDEHTDSDVITDVNSVHDVGVFAQITSIFSASGVSSKEEDGKEEGLTAVLYPHRRIKLTSLVSRNGSAAMANVQNMGEASRDVPPTPPESPSPRDPPSLEESPPSSSAIQARKLLLL